MHMRTIEEDYEYRMKNIMKKFVKDYNFTDLNAAELEDIIWTDYTTEFAHAVLTDMSEFADDELFEIEED